MSATPKPMVSAPTKAGTGPAMGDLLLKWSTAMGALAFPVIAALLVLVLVLESWDALRVLGPSFLLSNEWDVSGRRFGALPFIYGTIVTSLLAMLFAVPLGVGAAACLAEIAPAWIRVWATFLIELLAAIPSVVYGFWGIFFLVPVLQPLFSAIGAGSAGGRGLFTAGVLLALMVLPYITALSYDAIRSVPNAQRQASLALGASRWQTIWGVVLPNARAGILGGCLLGLGRAIGETMAVAMVIGNDPRIGSIFGLGYSIPSVLANQMPGENVIHRSALIALGLVLFGISLCINLIARWILRGEKRRLGRKGQPLGEPASQPATTDLTPAKTNPVQSSNRRTLNEEIMASAMARVRGKGIWIQRFDLVMTGLLALCVTIILLPLFHIFGYITWAGATNLNADFFTRDLSSLTSRGLGHAMIGSVVMVLIATVIGTPVGILGAVYLVEYRKSRLAHLTRFISELLTGVPSVLVGLFIYALLIQTASTPDSSLWKVPVVAQGLGLLDQIGWLVPHPSGGAGAMALAMMLMPVVLRTSEEALRTVPDALRRASYALGATPAQTVVRVIVPAATTAMITGVFLGMARIAGETAPLLFTAGSSNFWPDEGMGEKMPFLTYYIYTYSTGDKESEKQMAWAGAFVLLTLVMVVNIGMRLLSGRRDVAARRGQ
ncbi:MAG: phosphate ABC transporter permease subunit PstC [Gemmataceae bacterium]